MCLDQRFGASVTNGQMLESQGMHQLDCKNIYVYNPGVYNFEYDQHCCFHVFMKASAIIQTIIRRNFYQIVSYSFFTS